MRAVVISGSARSDNNTLRVAKAIANMLPDTDVIDFVDYDLPNANEPDIDPSSLSSFQSTLVETMRSADLVFVLTPEYNWFPSTEIINMVHQFANRRFKDIFDNKVFAFAGVSTGRGGRMPAVQLSYVFDKIFNYLHLQSISSPKKFESHFTTDCISESGELLDNQEYNRGLKAFVDYSLNVAKRWHSID